MQFDIKVLQNFLNLKNIDATVMRGEDKNPIHKYWVKLGPKCSLKKLENNSVEIGLALKSSAPIIAPEFSDGTVRLELMTGAHPVIHFDELAQKSGFNNFDTLKDKYELPVLLGTNDIDQPLIVDLTWFPHLLLAGTTGSGKSISEHCIIQSLNMHAKKNRVKLIPMDPKFVEFHQYDNLNSLLYRDPGVATSSEIIEERLADLTKEMDNRLRVLQKNGCRNLKEYRQKFPNKGTYLVIVIDELADLMRTTKKRFEIALDRLAAKSRAAGIHIVAATQYPHSDVVTSTIKANFDGRISFKVTDAVHSRVMLESGGAEKLQGKGDGFLSGADFKMQRFQGALVSLAKEQPSNLKKIKSFFSKDID